jgi:hypothetical protein
VNRGFRKVITFNTNIDHLDTCARFKQTRRVGTQLLAIRGEIVCMSIATFQMKVFWIVLPSIKMRTAIHLIGRRPCCSERKHWPPKRAFTRALRSRKIYRISIIDRQLGSIASDTPAAFNGTANCPADVMHLCGTLDEPQVTVGQPECPLGVTTFSRRDALRWSVPSAPRPAIPQRKPTLVDRISGNRAS